MLDCVAEQTCEQIMEQSNSTEAKKCWGKGGSTSDTEIKTFIRAVLKTCLGHILYPDSGRATSYD